MYAGCCNTQGDYIAIMKCDLQAFTILLMKILWIYETGKDDSMEPRRENCEEN